MGYESEPITALTLRRGACFGACPIYEVTLHSDGTADWEGEGFVEPVGRYHGQFDPNDFEKLAAFAGRAGFFGWDDEYRANVSDLPDYVLTAVAGKATKRVVQNGLDEPPDFWVIAELVDGIAEDIDWVEGTRDGRCGEWSATLTTFGIAAPLLSVKGTCTFNTAGFEVALRRHRPQPGDPALLLLDRIVTPPSGPVAEVITEVEASYVERTASVERVTILPEGITVAVEIPSRPSGEVAGR